MAQKFEVIPLLERVHSIGASDLHISVGVSPIVRINRQLTTLSEIAPLSVDDVEFFLSQILQKEQKDLLEINKELDFSVALGNKARFRVNAFFQRGYPSVALRLIPMNPPLLASLNLPKIVENICELRQGLVMIVGPTGHGKSTTLAGMLDRINETRAEHILSVEDPIEFVFANKKSVIDQREMYLDTHSWDIALKSVLRQDPNIVLIGEMRDLETIRAALQIAETGHLVFTTLHTNSAAQSVERIISSFPEDKRSEIRQQFSQVLEVVISQRLLIGKGGGMRPAVEILLATDAVRNLIREGKTHLLENVISNSISMGMTSLDRSLASLVVDNLVDYEEALKVSTRPDELRRLIKEYKFSQTQSSATAKK